MRRSGLFSEEEIAFINTGDALESLMYVVDGIPPDSNPSLAPPKPPKE